MAGIGILVSGVTGGGISLLQGVLAGAVLALTWTLLGGSRSVAWTDALLALVMIATGLLAVGLAVGKLGGPGAFWAGLASDTPAHLTVPGPGFWGLPTFLALAFPWFFFAISNPQVSQRLFMVKDLGAMRRMILWVLGFGFVFTLIAVIWGFAALRLMPGLEKPAGATAAVLSSGVLPVWVSVLLVVGILSAAVSTLDGIALTVGSLVARDLLPKDIGEQRQVMAGRVAVVVLIVFAVVFGLAKVVLVEQLAALSAVGLLPVVAPIIGAFFWQRATAAGALAALLGGFGAAAVMGFGLGIPPAEPVLPFTVALVSVGAFVIVSLLTKPAASALDFGAVIAEGREKHRFW